MQNDYKKVRWAKRGKGKVLIDSLRELWSNGSNDYHYLYTGFFFQDMVETLD